MDLTIIHTHCIIDGKPLTGRQIKFCSGRCSNQQQNDLKREKLQLSRSNQYKRLIHQNSRTYQLEQNSSPEALKQIKTMQL